MEYSPDEQYALDMDRQDPLARFRERFYCPEDGIYLDGNSLGLLSRDAERAIAHIVDQWKTYAIDGYSLPRPESWYYTGEELGRLTAPLVGAHPEEVVVTGTTTVNLHALLATFYRSTDRRRKILATSLDFPSDIYALQSQIRLHGGDPHSDLVLVPSRDGRTIEEDDVIDALGEEIAVAVLPSVLYRSGQLLDIARLARAAHERDPSIILCIDAAHSVGAVPHSFHDDGIDCAVWCSYKYLNAGPGSVAGLFVHEKHHHRLPGLAGWWGSDKEKQFDMAHAFTPAGHAGAWQISSNPQLSAAPLRASLAMFHEADIANIRMKSLAQTGYLMRLLEPLTALPYSYRIGTPREEARRGGHVAVEHEHADRICKVLKRNYRIVPDFRPPNVVRLAPVALYTRYHDIWQTVQALKKIVAQREFDAVEPGRGLIA